MACPIKQESGKTLVQITVPVCITISMDEDTGRMMSQDELAGLIDEYLDEITASPKGSGAEELWLHPRRWGQWVPVRCSLARYWDELPIDEMDITCVDDGCFGKRGDEEDEE
jgi:hypothetical protein